MDAEEPGGGHSSEIVEDKLATDEDASNEIRRAEEEWLFVKAHEFGIDVRVKNVDERYSCDRAEVASGIARYLRDANIEIPHIAGFSNRLWSILRSGRTEDFGVYFQADMNGLASRSSLRQRWDEFKQFRERFKCQSCGGKTFKRLIANLGPLCAGCEAPLAFQTRIWVRKRGP